MHIRKSFKLHQNIVRFRFFPRIAKTSIAFTIDLLAILESIKIERYFRAGKSIGTWERSSKKFFELKFSQKVFKKILRLEENF